MANSNKKRLISSLASTKLADLLISAKTTLPALLLSLGAPDWMISWLVPLRESGALLPQAAVGLILRRFPARHVIWRVGMIIQASGVALILATALLLDGVMAGATVMAALCILSLGRSACSLTVKDIEADVAAKGERGHLLGIASTISGTLTLLLAVPLVFYKDQLGQLATTVIILLALVAFIVGLFILFPVKTRIDTDTSSTDKEDKTRFWQFDNVVYRFILVRGLFVHSALIAPYFMLESESDATTLLPLYLAAQAGATMLSSIIWGKIADKSARTTLQFAGTLALVAVCALLFIGASTVWVSALLFFILSVAHTGVRTGRKTYSLDVREGQQRTELVAFSNTAIGIILLVFGALYAYLSSVLAFSVVYIMAGFLFIGILLTGILPGEKAQNS
ncbi:MFS transporter [Alteromonas confluentis]|uniref:MFS transporter permease n=1 Tax=Alteromonas confluentis TaxID=1656094 RepID=A0A1E7ZGK7_9ALTE|nr:MFS transporter [Alteromonas confluentis]OFC72655.1 MFS transporter permease [Alteromonas confluentis]